MEIGDSNQQPIPTEQQMQEEQIQDEQPQQSASPVLSDSSKSNSEADIAQDEKKELLKKRKLCGLIEGCDSIENYVHLNKIHEGVYGVVFRAKDKINEKIYAIKKVKLLQMGKEGFPLTSIREINILFQLEHENIVGLREVCVGSSWDKIYVVMEYVEHELKDLMEWSGVAWKQAEIKCLMMQFLKALEYLHTYDYLLRLNTFCSRSIFHRDLKTSNLLYTNKGRLKLCDFGLARKFSSLPRAYTPVVVTLWYRAPEVLLGCDRYSAAIDIWSAGCIFAELVAKAPLFPGKNEIEELDQIFRQFGTPTEDTWPGWHDYKYASNIKFKQHLGARLEDRLPKGVLSEQGFNLLKEMLMMNPNQRISASKALKHPWFKEQPFAQNEELMPTFKPMNEMPREMRRKSMKKKVMLEKPQQV